MASNTTFSLEVYYTESGEKDVNKYISMWCHGFINEDIINTLDMDKRWMDFGNKYLELSKVREKTVIMSD